MTNDQIITLRTGAQVERDALRAVSMSIRQLERLYYSAFHELVMLARDPKYQVEISTLSTLTTLRLLEPDGQMRDATRDIILASTEGEDFAIRLVPSVSNTEART